MSTARAPIDVGDLDLEPLAVCERLFSELEVSGIAYCHWKSNEHLDESLAGKGDLDLLVREEDRARFEGLLDRLDFKRVSSPPVKRFPGMADYLGFDPERGALVHLHVHYRLVLGEQRVKNHHLPVEEWLLEGSTMLLGVRVPRPERELVLLVIRACLKTDVRSLLRCLLRGRPHPLPRSVHRELIWLLERTDDPEVLAALRASALPVAAASIGDFLRRARAGRLPALYVYRKKRVILRNLRHFQRYPTPIGALRKAWLRVRYSRPIQRIRPVQRKMLPAGGVYLALVGADGVGKTTLAGDLERWLRRKLEVRWFLFGQPHDDLLLRFLRRSRKLSNRAGRRLHVQGLASWASSQVEAVEWLYLARRRSALGAKARRLTGKGCIIIAERFPLREFWTMQAPMDGPRLPLDAPSRTRRLLARIERRFYERIEPPGVILVLSAPFELLRGRRNMNPQMHQLKIEAVNRLGSRGGRQVIDAGRSYPEVLLSVKSAVWDAM